MHPTFFVRLRLPDHVIFDGVLTLIALSRSDEGLRVAVLPRHDGIMPGDSPDGALLGREGSATLLVVTYRILLDVSRML
jgi:hypothetical protein